jgi:hypothetical protein
MNLRDTLSLASQFGVNALSSSEDINSAMTMPGAKFLAGLHGIDLVSMNTIINEDFRGDAKKSFEFMNYAATTKLGDSDPAELIRNGGAKKLAELWQSDPNHKAFFEQYPVLGASNTAGTSNAGPVASGPGAPNAPSLPTPSTALGTLLTTLAQNLAPGANLDSAALMNSIAGLVGAYARFDPTFSMAKSFLNGTLDALQKSDFFGAGQGHMPDYAKIRDIGNTVLASLAPQSVGAGKSPSGPTTI